MRQRMLMALLIINTIIYFIVGLMLSNSFAVDITMLPEIAAPVASVDKVVVYDSSKPAEQRIAGITFSTNPSEYLNGQGIFIKPSRSKDFQYIDPDSGEELLLFKSREDMIITDIHCIVKVGVSATITIQECNSSGSGCIAIDSPIICDNDGAEDDGAFTDAVIASGNWVNMAISNVDGNRDSLLTVSIYY